MRDLFENMCDQNASHIDWENELGNALENGEFEVYYQPLVELGSGLPTGFEALIRWNHPRLGLISPTEFLTNAEQNDLIFPIGAWVLRTACRQVREWQAKLNPPSGLTIGVNLSAKQFRQTDLADQIEAVLAETRLPASCLILEVSEHDLMRDVKFSASVLERLGSIGVRLAMDDFGLGYSSLVSLHRFPLDILKLDRSFILNMAADKQTLRVASTIVALTERLGIKVIAEGVETHEQAEMLRAVNCRRAQGYLYSRPLASDQAEYWLSDHFPARPPYPWNLFEIAAPQYHC